MAENAEESGSGAPDGGSPEGDHDGKPKGEDLVPASRLAAALADQERRLTAKFEAQLAEASRPKVDPPKQYTRAELNAMVTAGSISQEQADSQIDLQVREGAKADAIQAATTIITAAQRKERVTSEIARYTALMPELLQDGSKEREKVRTEFQYLTGLGQPKTLETELAAIRAAFGPVETLEQSRRGKPDHESHQEHGAGGGSPPRKSGSGKLFDNLGAREKKYYEGLIDKGIYKDAAEVEEVLKYAKPNRQRTSARA